MTTSPRRAPIESWPPHRRRSSRARTACATGTAGLPGPRSCGCPTRSGSRSVTPTAACAGGWRWPPPTCSAPGGAPAATTTPPAVGTAAFTYLRDRLITSWDIPWGVATFASWSMTPDDSFFGISGVGRRTLRDQLPKVRAAIDAGGLVLLGLVTVHTFNLGEIGRNHTVLGYRYRTGPGTASIAVYDPNSPGRDDIGITIDTDADDSPAHHPQRRDQAPDPRLLRAPAGDRRPDTGRRAVARDRSRRQTAGRVGGRRHPPRGRRRRRRTDREHGRAGVAVQLPGPAGRRPGARHGQRDQQRRPDLQLASGRSPGRGPSSPASPVASARSPGRRWPVGRSAPSCCWPRRRSRSRRSSRSCSPRRRSPSSPGAA